MSPCARAGLVLVIVALLGTTHAQVARQERRTVAAHAELLHELWRNSRGIVPEELAKLDDALLSDGRAHPFAPLARALATSAGVPGDETFSVGCFVHVNALSEVVDPEVYEDGDHKVPFRLHVTLHAPVRLATEQPLGFALDLRDQARKVVWSGSLGPATRDDLAAFTVHVAIPVQELPDGAYDVHARIRIGEEAPRPNGPVARGHVCVRRGFASRAKQLEVAMAAALARSLTAGDRAALLGAHLGVQRIYQGEASDGALDLEAELQYAERVLANVAADRPALHGATGFAPCAVELSAGPSPHQPSRVLRFRLRAPSPRPGLFTAPLVLFQVGPPSWDGAWARPTSARTMPAGFFVRTLLHAAFDADAQWGCAVVDSEGEVDNPTAALGKVIEAIAAAVPVDLQRVVLVGEREAAATALSAATQSFLPRTPRGIVCVAGGALAPPQLSLLETTSLLLVPARGHASQANLQQIVELGARAGHAERLRMVTPARAWSWALPCALPAIERFCLEVLR